MFCATSSCCGDETVAFEELQNLGNWSKVAADEAALAKREKFLTRTIHQLKKMLKFGTKSLAAKRRSLEQRRKEDEAEAAAQRDNRANELLERKLAAEWLERERFYDEQEQNMANENWENWDGCYLCAGGQQCPPRLCASPVRVSEPQHLSPYNSVCYVFMPGQPEPVPVRMRTARIPGGVMWISYRPDLDLRGGDVDYAYTSSQMAQGQSATAVGVLV